jgi:general secretion pathway protein M
VGDTDSLRKILYDLESQTPLLFVDNLDVSARENRPRLPNGRLASYTRVQLSVQFEVSGYLRKEGG